MLCFLFLIIGIIPLWANLQAKHMGTVIRLEKTKHSLIFSKERKSIILRTLSISLFIIILIPRKKLILILRKSILNSRKIKLGIRRISITPIMRPKGTQELLLHLKRLILKSRKRIRVSWSNRNRSHQNHLYHKEKAFWLWFLQ